MSEYKRLTYRYEHNPQWVGTIDRSNGTESENSQCIQRLCELEDEIENGTLVRFKYAKGDTVYLIGYVCGEIKTCECCGQEYYPDPEPHKVVKGIVSARRYIEPDENVREEGGIFYRILTDNNGELSWYTDRHEKDLFNTEQEAEAKLKELKGDNE